MIVLFRHGATECIERQLKQLGEVGDWFGQELVRKFSSIKRHQARASRGREIKGLRIDKFVHSMSGDSVDLVVSTVGIQAAFIARPPRAPTAANYGMASCALLSDSICR